MDISQLQASKNDIVYCGDKVVAVANRMKAYNGGAQWGKTKTYANQIVDSMSTMSPFISAYFEMVNGGFGDPLQLTDEELQCMRATLWYESELKAKGALDKISFLIDNQIFVAPTNTNSSGESNQANTTNQTNESNEGGNEDEVPFYKQTWFVALGGILVVGGVGYIGYNAFIKSDENDKISSSRDMQGLQKLNPRFYA